MAIFLQEGFINPSHNTEAQKVFESLMEEYHITPDSFKMFNDPDCGYEIMYEAEIAYNAIKEEMMLQEMTIIREESSDGSEESAQKKKSWWERFVAMIKGWWDKFRKFLSNVWQSIKNFFKAIYARLFKRDAWKRLQDQLKNKAEKEKTADIRARIDYEETQKKLSTLQSDYDTLKTTLAEQGKALANAEATIKSMKEDTSGDEKIESLINKNKELDDKISQVSDTIKDGLSKVKEDMNERSKGFKTSLQKVQNDISKAQGMEGSLKALETLIDGYMAQSVHYGEQATKYAEEGKKAFGSKNPKKGNYYKKLAERAQRLSTHFRDAANAVTQQAMVLKTAINRVSMATVERAA